MKFELVIASDGEVEEDVLGRPLEWDRKKASN